MRPPLPLGAHGDISTTKLSSGKWRARAYCRDTSGRRRDVTASAATKAAATNKLKEKIAGLTTTEQDLSRARLIDFAERWYTDYAPTVGRSAQRQTRFAIEHHIRPVGEIRLNELTVPWLDEQIQKASIKRTRGGQTVGGESVARRLRVIYRMILREAVRQGALTMNLADSTRPIKRKDSEVKALSPGELTVLRRSVRTYYAEYPYWTRVEEWLPDLVDFLVGTGCRVGEAIAVSWEDVDLESGVCHIRATALTDGGASIYQPFTKTKQARAVTMPDWLILALVSRGPGEGYVFQAKGGGMVKYSTLKGAFAKALPEGMEWVTPKTIRASVATMIERELGLEAAGLQLGHDDFKTTKRSYIERRGVSDAVSVLGSL